MDNKRWIDEIEPVTLPPWWMHQGRCLWWVEEGAVDIFATGIRDGEPTGPRRPLYRVYRKMALMPVERDLLGSHQALLAVPVPNTRVRPVPLDQLTRLSEVADARDEVIALAASWIGVITRGLPMPPKDYVPLRSGPSLPVSEGKVYCAVEHLLWVRLAGGAAAFMGESDLAVTPDAPAVPLRNDVWFRAQSDVMVETVDPLKLLESGEIWRGIALYQQLAIRHAVRSLERTGRDELSRLQIKAQRAGQVMNEALTRFISVVRGEDEPVRALSSDPTLAACELIGRQLKLEFRVPPKRATPRETIDAVQEIADASAVRTRQVALKGEWWKEDNGPLLALHADTRAPYALLPVKDRRYDLHDPATGEVKRVTPDVAGNLAAFATQFYRPFPGKPIGIAAMLRFGVHGLWREIALLIALGALGGLIGMAIPIATGRMVDAVIPSAQHNDAVVLMLALIAALLAAEIFEFVRSVAVLRVEGKMDNSVQAAVWDRVLSLPVPFFRAYTAGDLANRINGINMIRHTLSGTTVTTLLSSTFSMFNFFVLFYYSAKL
ncbi:MAG TPA: ABC transporter transmembrane domain-containing protein, partial [Burkholderiales bacterium]|nr:ABC transporter transmembrane domain-containing protein [Burkholderiales bacterium]